MSTRSSPATWRQRAAAIALAIVRPWRAYLLWVYALGGLALIAYGAGEIYPPLRTLLPGALIWLDISRRARAPAKPKPKPRGGPRS